MPAIDSLFQVVQVLRLNAQTDDANALIVQWIDDHFLRYSSSTDGGTVIGCQPTAPLPMNGA